MSLRKSWRWVGAFGPDAMLCIARARIGVLGRTWWAVWDYEQPFGTFTGSLPVAGPLHGWGVMERHEALW
jgi:hypothetical protein